MLDSVEQLRGMRGNYVTYEDLVMRCCDIADEIEHEVEERYVEKPVDADGMVIAPADNMVDSNGEQFVVSSIELLASGEWLVYGNGKLGSEFAKLCHHHKPPTDEDVLREFVKSIAEVLGGDEFLLRDDDEMYTEFAAKLRLREGQ